MSPAPQDPSRSQAPKGAPDEKPPSRFSWISGVLLLVMLGAMWFLQGRAQRAEQPPVEYSTVFGWAQAGKLESVVMRGQLVEGKLKAPETLDGKSLKEFRAYTPHDDGALVALLRDKGVHIRIDVEDRPFAIELLLGLLPWALILGVWIWLSRSARRMMSRPGGPLAGVLQSRGRRFDRETSVNVTFDDVAGLTAAKRDLREIVDFLKAPDRFNRLGGKVPRGVLLVGPPGTGKTLLARAVAGEAGVPFFSINGSEFIEMFVGVGAARVRDLFAEAKKNAPAIVFIDEVDAVGRSRSAGIGVVNDERDQTLNQLLSEMDGFERSDLTIVLAATNRPDVLDPALLRPGRFDRRVVVDRPELAARRAILAVHVRDKPVAPDVDLDAIAANTPGFSGADLANLVNEAALAATRRGGTAIGQADFLGAFDKIMLGDPREAKLDDQEKRRVAVHEAGHTLVARYTKEAEPLYRVSIIPRGMALGVSQQTPSANRHLMTQPELFARLKVLMGGYAAERIVLGSVSTGAENDLAEATRIATKMVANYGMSETLGPVHYESEERPFLGQPMAIDSGRSDKTASAIEREARALLTRALADAEGLVSAHRVAHGRLVDELVATETVERGRLDQLFAGEASAASPPAKKAAPSASVA